MLKHKISTVFCANARTCVHTKMQQAYGENNLTLSETNYKHTFQSILLCNSIKHIYLDYRYYGSLYPENVESSIRKKKVII